MAMAKKELATFESRLQTTPFLDAATRAEAIAKAKQIQIVPLSAPRDTYSDVDVSSADYVANKVAAWTHFAKKMLARIDRKPGPGTSESFGFSSVNAFYDPGSNSFTLLPGLVHGTFFGGSSAPAAHNFGALGWVIGHEMTHGFDNNGRLYDGRGADRNWWTPGAEAAFNQRAACFVDEYSRFVVEDATDPATGQHPHVDGALTLGENIADNGGIRTAYQTAEPYFGRGKPDKGFTPEQQFFIAAGQLWCEKYGNAARLTTLQFDPHAPGKARVNDTLSNFEKFADAFKCKAGDAMVANACVLW
jgi:predicted metalloendopeptidase